MSTFTKRPLEVIKLVFQFARELETVWRPGEEYALNTEVRPTEPNGAQYKATTAGQSGIDEPVWPAIAATVSDGVGALVWTGIAISTNASDTISTRTVTADPGLTIDSSAIDGTKVNVWISGGTHGKTYRVDVQIVTAAGETLYGHKYVKVEKPKRC